MKPCMLSALAIDFSFKKRPKRSFQESSISVPMSSSLCPHLVPFVCRVLGRDATFYTIHGGEDMPFKIPICELINLHNSNMLTIHIANILVSFRDYAVAYIICSHRWSQYTNSINAFVPSEVMCGLKTDKIGYVGGEPSAVIDLTDVRVGFPVPKPWPCVGYANRLCWM